MTFEKLPLTSENIVKYEELYSQNNHFLMVVLPRLILWLRIKEHCDGDGHLEWSFRWAPVQVGKNEITISLPDPRGEFHFYYAVPLLQPFKVLLYLGDNTFNFFEAHPLLVAKGVVADGEFPIDATLNSLPCLVLSKNNMVYPSGSLLEIQENGLAWNGDVYNLSAILSNWFSRFNPILEKIINGTLIA